MKNKKRYGQKYQVFHCWQLPQPYLRNLFFCMESIRTMNLGARKPELRHGSWLLNDQKSKHIGFISHLTILDSYSNYIILVSYSSPSFKKWVHFSKKNRIFFGRCLQERFQGWQMGALLDHTLQSALRLIPKKGDGKKCRESPAVSRVSTANKKMRNTK